MFFKCELFQKTGSFKARGACNAVLLTPPECRDVVTHSSGNHAQVPHTWGQAGGLFGACSCSERVIRLMRATGGGCVPSLLHGPMLNEYLPMARLIRPIGEK